MHPQTAYRWFREGTLPMPAVRVGPRTVLVSPMFLWPMRAAWDCTQGCRRMIRNLTWTGKWLG